MKNISIAALISIASIFSTSAIAELATLRLLSPGGSDTIENYINIDGLSTSVYFHETETSLDLIITSLENSTAPPNFAFNFVSGYWSGEVKVFGLRDAIISDSFLRTLQAKGSAGHVYDPHPDDGDVVVSNRWDYNLKSKLDSTLDHRAGSVIHPASHWDDWNATLKIDHTRYLGWKFDIHATHIGESTPIPLPIPVVPSPHSAVLLAMSGVVVGCRRRRSA